MKPTLKVILVGNTSVGKTSIISSYFSQKIDNEIIPTVAPAYSCTDIIRKDKKTICLQIWDTAGQERYQSIGKLFYRDSDIALICYDPKNPESVESIFKWVNSVHEESEMAQFFLVLTKSDLFIESEINQFKMEAIRIILESNIKHYFITSSLKKIGINELFEYIAEQCDINKCSYISPIINSNINKNNCCYFR